MLLLVNGGARGIPKVVNARLLHCKMRDCQAWSGESPRKIAVDGRRSLESQRRCRQISIFSSSAHQPLSMPARLHRHLAVIVNGDTVGGLLRSIPVHPVVGRSELMDHSAEPLGFY